MARVSHCHAIDRVAELISESVELLEEISTTLDDTDGMITIWTGDDESITAFSESGIDVLKELIADIRNCDDGIAPNPMANSTSGPIIKNKTSTWRVL